MKHNNVHHLDKPVSATALYFRLAWALKTPFIFMLDRRYRRIEVEMVKNIVKNIGITYHVDYADCDDFAWLFKAMAIREGINGVGFVIGSYKGMAHAWNVVIGFNHIYQIEPQNGHNFQELSGYRPWAVII